MELEINDDSITLAKGQQGVVGEERVLLDGDDNLIEGTPWEADGYTVAPFLAADSWRTLVEGVHTLIAELLREAGFEVPDGFRGDRYHEVIGDDQEAHLAIARSCSKGFSVDRLAVPHGAIVERIEALCGKPLTMFDPNERDELFCLRTVRPRRGDNNPLHRDPWLDHLRNAVNLYIPIAGSSERSSLALVPGSHQWKESETEKTDGGAKIGEARFSVPSLVAARRPVRAIRPNPGENEVLVFSPYLLHGGASNREPDATRVSLEIRLWRRA